jgi:hypothetical protein
MNVIRSTAKVIARSADTTVTAAGAVGGAAVNGVIGGVQGTVNGIRSGLDSGSHSTPAAVLTIAAVGATGLVEWPVLLGIGATALAVRRLNQQTGNTAAPTLSAVPDEPPKKAPPRPSARKSTKAAKSTTPRGPRKTTSGRRAPAKR